MYRVQVAVSTGYRGLGTEYRWLLVQNTGGCRHRVQVAVGTEFIGEVQSTEARHLSTGGQGTECRGRGTEYRGPRYRVQGPRYRVPRYRVQGPRYRG